MKFEMGDIVTYKSNKELSILVTQSNEKYFYGTVLTTYSNSDFHIGMIVCFLNESYDYKCKLTSDIISNLQEDIFKKDDVVCHRDNLNYHILVTDIISKESNEFTGVVIKTAPPSIINVGNYLNNFCKAGFKYLCHFNDYENFKGIKTKKEFKFKIGDVVKHESWDYYILVTKNTKKNDEMFSGIILYSNSSIEDFKIGNHFDSFLNEKFKYYCKFKNYYDKRNAIAK